MTLTEQAKIYGFRQLETALIAFVQNIESKFHNYIEDIPVFVLWTGDNNLYMNTKLVQLPDSEVYEQNPRVVIKFNSFSDDVSNHTNQYNKYIFKGTKRDNSDIIAECTMRRLPISFDVAVTFVSSNFIDALQHAEMIFSINNRENAFSYEYQGSVFNAAFAVDSSQEFTFPEVDSGTRNFTQSIPLKLEIQLYSPRIETVKEYKPIEGVRITLGISDRQDIYTSSRDIIRQQLNTQPDLKKEVDKALRRQHKEITEDNEIEYLMINQDMLERQEDITDETTITG